MSDVIIVGAGVIGLATAVELARRGASVTVVDAAHPGAGASGRSQGMLLPHGSGPYTELVRPAWQAYHELADAVDLDFGLRPGTQLMLAADEEHLTRARAELAGLRAAGFYAEELDESAVKDLCPGVGPVAGAVAVPDVWTVDPGLVTYAWQRAARIAGARFHFGAEALRVNVTANRAREVQTPDERLSAGSVLLAGGTAQRSLLTRSRLPLPVLGVQGWLLSVAPPPGALRDGVLLTEPGWVAPGQTRRSAVPPTVGDFAGGAQGARVSFALRALSDGSGLLGSSREALPRDPGTPDRAAAAIAARAARFISAVRDWPVTAVRRGVRPALPDGLPAVGRLGPDRLWVSTGHAGDGVLLAPVCARLLADALLDPPGALPPAFDPGRFAGPSQLIQERPDEKGTAWSHSSRPRNNSGCGRDSAYGESNE